MGTPRIKKRNPKEQRAKKKLADTTKLTNAQVKKAMLEASVAIDRLSGEVASLKQIIISERAQLIYFTELAVGYAKHEIVDITIKNFSDLPEDKQEAYIKQAIRELGSEEAPAEKPKGKIEIVQ